LKRQQNVSQGIAVFNKYQSITQKCEQDRKRTFMVRSISEYLFESRRIHNSTHESRNRHFIDRIPIYYTTWSHGLKLCTIILITRIENINTYLSARVGIVGRCTSVTAPEMPLVDSSCPPCHRDCGSVAVSAQRKAGSRRIHRTVTQWDQRSRRCISPVGGRPVL